MAINHDKLKNALKMMNEIPQKLTDYENIYQSKVNEIKTNRDYSPNFQDRILSQAKTDRDNYISHLIGQMENAIVTISENNNFENEGFDFSDPKFQSAINYLNLMGKDMSYTDQLNLLESFRGNPGVLKALGSAFKKNSLYFSKQADEMVKPIPDSALEDASYVAAKYRYNGELDMGKMYWSKGEFKKQAERLGYDISSGDSPYISALKDAKNNIPQGETVEEKAKAQKMQYDLSSTIQKIKEAEASGEGNIEELFSSTLRKYENDMSVFKTEETDTPPDEMTFLV